MPERPKSSLPTAHACNHGPAPRPPQSHVQRRLLRVHRAVSECMRQGMLPNSLVPSPLSARVRAVLNHASQVTHSRDLHVRDAVQGLDTAITAQERLCVEVRTNEWRANSADYASIDWKAANAALKAPTPAPGFTADDMSSRLPSFPARGRRGLAAGLPANSRRSFVIARPLLRNSITCMFPLGFSLMLNPSDYPPDSLWSWKVLGIPKRTAFDSRPISIGSLLVGTCHAVPYGQYCGRHNMSVTIATASYLSSRPEHVAETDLSRAFDSLFPELAETALTHHGAPAPVALMLAHAWRGPRICTVQATSPLLCILVEASLKATRYGLWFYLCACHRGTGSLKRSTLVCRMPTVRRASDSAPNCSQCPAGLDH